MEARDPVQLIADEQPRLARELREVPTDAWRGPSDCAGWSNARVVAHLAFHAGVYRDNITRALNGDRGPPVGPDGQPMTREPFLALASNREQLLVDEAPGALLEQFARTGQELVDLLQRLATTDRDRPAWHSSGTVTIGTLIAYRTYELGLHGWDIRVSMDPAADVRPELCPFLVGLAWRLLPLVCHPDPGLQGTGRVEVDGQAWTARAQSGTLEQAPPSAVPDAVIRTDGSTFLLLASSRRSLDQRSERVSIEGDRQQGERFLGAIRYRI